MATRCFWPPLSWTPRSPTWGFRVVVEGASICAVRDGWLVDKQWMVTW
jgi:hypothetical protein